MTELVKPVAKLLFQSAEKNADQYDAKTRHSVANPWQLLSHFTDARIGLGRAGVSVPTQALLDFYASI